MCSVRSFLADFWRSTTTIINTPRSTQSSPHAQALSFVCPRLLCFPGARRRFSLERARTECEEYIIFIWDIAIHSLLCTSWRKGLRLGFPLGLVHWNLGGIIFVRIRREHASFLPQEGLFGFLFVHWYRNRVVWKYWSSTRHRERLH